MVLMGPSNSRYFVILFGLFWSFVSDLFSYTLCTTHGSSCHSPVLDAFIAGKAVAFSSVPGGGGRMAEREQQAGESL